MVLYRVNGQFPVILTQLDQSLRESDNILKVHIHINHTMTHQQVSLQTLCIVNGRTTRKRKAVGKRLIQDIGSISMVIVRPISNRTQGGTRSKNTRPGEHGHQGNESSIGSTIYPDPRRIDTQLLHQVTRAIHMIAKVFVAHIPVDPCTPVTPIPRTTPVVDIKHRITLICQKIMKKILPEIGAPPFMNIL